MQHVRQTTQPGYKRHSKLSNESINSSRCNRQPQPRHLLCVRHLATAWRRLVLFQTPGGAGCADFRSGDARGNTADVGYLIGNIQ